MSVGHTPQYSLEFSSPFTKGANSFANAVAFGYPWSIALSKSAAPLMPVALSPRSLPWFVRAATNIWLCRKPAESSDAITLDWEKPAVEIQDTTTAFAPESLAAVA